MVQLLAVAIVALCCFLTVHALDSPFPIQFQKDETSSPPLKPEHWLYEGDIKLSEDQDQMVEFPKKNGEGKISSHRAHTTAHEEKRLWYGGVIPYVFDCSLKNMPGLVAVVKRAMKEWQSKTCVMFVERDKEEDYVQIFRGTHCYSTVGRAKGKKVLSVGHGCEYHNVMLHEIGHVIGYWHEQSRPDRDEYVRILWRHVMRGWENTFMKLNWKAVDTMSLPYDYSSIMHYPFNAFSKSAHKRTIVPLRPVKARPYKLLSKLDILRTNIMYSCSNNEENEVEIVSQQSSVAALRRKRRSPIVEDIDKPTTKYNPNCKNKVGDGACKYWAEKGFCTKRKDFMLTDCMKSCNACSTVGTYRGTLSPRVTVVNHVSPMIHNGIITEVEQEITKKEAKRKARKAIKLMQKERKQKCKDRRSSCGYWTKKGYCHMRPKLMARHCIKSCNKCYPDPKECVDRDQRCRLWARWRYCSRLQYKPIMESFCTKTCGHCNAAKMCFDKEKSKCPKWKENGFCKSEDKDIMEAMKMLCTKTCHFCDKDAKRYKKMKCVDNFMTCQRWHKLKYCHTRPMFMNKYCRKSCNICTTQDSQSKKDVKCLDNAVGCEQRKAEGLCEKRRKTMIFYCRKTCRFCVIPKQSDDSQDVKRIPCEDKNRHCSKYSGFGYCYSKALYMMKNCKKSCGMCTENGAVLFAPRKLYCKNRRRACTYWALIGMCKIRRDLMLKDCKLACRACIPAKKDESYHRCKNIGDDDNCEHWAALGKCVSRPNFMISQCPKTCNACPNKPVKTTPANYTGVLCKRSCKMWIEKGFCAKWRNRCLRACLANGCDVEPVKPVGRCAESMGAGWDFKLPDSAFTASSTLKSGSWDFGARNARLYKEDDRIYKRVGGWCAKEPQKQWLQIDLGGLQIITAVATQGRDKFFEHVKSYELGFSDDGKTFYKYTEKGKVKLMRGNCDHFTPVLNQLRKPHLARYIRFYPITQNSVCMRVEVYGCKELTDEAKHDYPHVVNLRHYKTYRS